MYFYNFFVSEKVDILISEPMGYMLYNERMIESYVHAKKFLKTGPGPQALMFPSMGDLYRTLSLFSSCDNLDFHFERTTSVFFFIVRLLAISSYSLSNIRKRVFGVSIASTEST